MKNYLRFFAVIICLVLIGACTGGGSGSPELSRTPQASIDKLLKEARSASPQQAAVKYLDAAEQSWKTNDSRQTADILGRVKLELLSPEARIRAKILDADLALTRHDASAALNVLSTEDLAQLDTLPVTLQARAHETHAKALAADNQQVAALQERIYIAPLLDGAQASRNNDAIWDLVYPLAGGNTLPTDNQDLNGWVELAQLAARNSDPRQRQTAVNQWMTVNPRHPATLYPPKGLAAQETPAATPPTTAPGTPGEATRIALLLPQQGQLANVGKALRDGFMAALYQDSQSGTTPPDVRFYDSATITSISDFYQQTKADGVQLVIGPLEKDLVTQLNLMPELPVTTLALNYAEGTTSLPPQLFQFGLAPEDEAQEVAKRAWADGKRNALAIIPQGEWGDRVLTAFRQSWQGMGGTLLGVQSVGAPTEIAGQITRLLSLRTSPPPPDGQTQETPASQGDTPTDSGNTAASVPADDTDFIFLVATPAQARQIKPTIDFANGSDLPVYATSHLNDGRQNPTQNGDLNGIRFCETPWLLNPGDPLRAQISQQNPQADGSMGRLYAMGADAWLLASSGLDAMRQRSGRSVSGHSGQLSVTADGRIARQLSWAQFQNGIIVPLP